MERTNFHTHTDRCLHAGGPDTAYIEEAIKNNLLVLGMSDHAPYRDDRFIRMKFNQLEEYLNSMYALKEAYKNQIEIRVGLEIEYDPRETSYYEWLLTQGVEYFVFGQHFYLDDKNEFVNIYELKHTGQYIEYANSVVEGMKSGYFQILAHPDVIFVNDFAWDDNCERACDILIEGAITYQIPLELNANGIRRGIGQFVDGPRYLYPHEKFWKKVATTSIPVMINSDAHSPEAVYDEAMEEALLFAKKLKLNLVTDYKKS